MTSEGTAAGTSEHPGAAPTAAGAGGVRVRGDASTPTVALLLGYAGVAPFAAVAGALWVAPMEQHPRLAEALVAYGAVILSFVGAVYWGLAMGTDGSRRDRWLGLGVAPALIGWMALLAPHAIGLGLLIVTFAGLHACDVAAAAAGLAPRWYRRMRVRLTAAVVACLAVGAAAVWMRPA